MASNEPQDMRCEQSSGSLKLKIFLKKPEVDQEDAEISAAERPLKTSDALYAVLSEIHRLCVQRDTKRIFAMPVTTDIAPDYFEVISHPMDLGTMFSRLESRSHYTTAPQYFTDLRQMCHNAMLYNPPETVYYQKARKLLNFGEKQMTPNGLRKLSLQLLGNSNALTPEELGVSEESFRQHSHHHQHHRHHHGNRHRHEAQQGSRHSASKLREDGASELEEDEEEDNNNTMLEEENSNINGEDTLDSFASSSARKRRRRCRRDSSASLSSTPSTTAAAAAPARKAPRYAAAPNSPPLLVTEVLDSPLNRPRLSRGDTGDAITIDQETPEADTSLTLSPASTVSSSSRLRTARNPPTTTPPQARKKPAASSTPRQSGSKVRRSRHPPPSAVATQVPPKPERVFAEDRWNFTGSVTDRRSPAQVLAHNRRAAKLARQRYLEKYGDPIKQRIVYLDTSETGVIYAKDLDQLKSADGSAAAAAAEGDDANKGQVVGYPLALRNLLTPQPPSSAGTYHGLVEQMTSQQVATLHALSDLRYDPAEPIAMGVHGPLAIFEKEELEQLCDAYGGDATVMESVLSTLTFVEDLGPTARRWAHLRLAEATRGYHARMLIAFADEDGQFAENNWMKKAGLTIDKSLVEEFKARFWREEEEAAAAAAAAMATPTSETSTAEEPMETSGGSGGQMSMAKLPTNTSTTSATDKQMATAQALTDKKPDGEIKAVEEVDEEDDDSFDILSAALSASVTPVEQKSMIIQQQQQLQPPPPPLQQQQQSNQFLLTTCGVPLALEAPLPPPQAPPQQTQSIANPLVASVNEIAQISALTAAISPIQQQTNLPPPPTIGLIEAGAPTNPPPLPPPPPLEEQIDLVGDDSSKEIPLKDTSKEPPESLETLTIPSREHVNFVEDGDTKDSEESFWKVPLVKEADRVEASVEESVSSVGVERGKSVESQCLKQDGADVAGEILTNPAEANEETSLSYKKSPVDADEKSSTFGESRNPQVLTGFESPKGIVLSVQEKFEKSAECEVSLAEKMEFVVEASVVPEMEPKIVHEKGTTSKDEFSEESGEKASLEKEESNEQGSLPSADQLTEIGIVLPVQEKFEMAEKMEFVGEASVLPEIPHEEGTASEESSEEAVEKPSLDNEERTEQGSSSADQMTRAITAEPGEYKPVEPAEDEGSEDSPAAEVLTDESSKESVEVASPVETMETEERAKPNGTTVPVPKTSEVMDLTTESMPSEATVTEVGTVQNSPSPSLESLEVEETEKVAPEVVQKPLDDEKEASPVEESPRGDENSVFEPLEVEHFDDRIEVTVKSDEGKVPPDTSGETTLEKANGGSISGVVLESSQPGVSESELSEEVNQTHVEDSPEKAPTAPEVLESTAAETEPKAVVQELQVTEVTSEFRPVQGSMQVGFEVDLTVESNPLEPEQSIETVQESTNEAEATSRTAEDPSAVVEAVSLEANESESPFVEAFNEENVVELEAPNVPESLTESVEANEPEIPQNLPVVETFVEEDVVVVEAPNTPESSTESTTVPVETEEEEANTPSDESAEESPSVESKLEEEEAMEIDFVEGPAQASVEPPLQPVAVLTQQEPVTPISETVEDLSTPCLRPLDFHETLVPVAVDQSSFETEAPAPMKSPEAEALPMDVPQSPTIPESVPQADDETSQSSSNGSAVNFGGLVNYACTEPSEVGSSCHSEQGEGDLSTNEVYETSSNRGGDGIDDGAL